MEVCGEQGTFPLKLYKISQTTVRSCLVSFWLVSRVFAPSNTIPLFNGMLVPRLDMGPFISSTLAGVVEAN